MPVNKMGKQKQLTLTQMLLSSLQEFHLQNSPFVDSSSSVFCLIL